MKVAFILDHALMHYRIPFFNLLQERYGHDIVVYHSGKLIKEGNVNFNQIIVKNIKILGIFDYRTNVDIKSHDIIVCMQNIRLLNLWTLSVNPFRRYRVIQWGIGTSSASGLGSQSSTIKIVRNFLMSFADAIVFYSFFPIKYLSSSHKNKTFVALNSVENVLKEDLSSYSKKAFIDRKSVV